MRGLMQDRPLMISGILAYAAAAHGEREIVSRLIDEPVWRYDYAACAARVAQAANMLRAIGIGPGDRVSSLAWNTHRHLELFYAVPGIGAVLQTANPRLHEDQIAYTINHAGSSVLFFERDFLPLVERLKSRIPLVRRYIMLSDADRLDAGEVGAESYETLISGYPADHSWPTFDENSAAILCYTSGTTGVPKGVLYSHRSIVLHGIAGGLSGALAFSAFDCVMPCSSLYHATAWGIPFIAPINGCKLVLPCDKMDGESLHELIVGEGVTFTNGVPTIWTMYLAHLEQHGLSPETLDRVVIGGSAVPRIMAETFQRRYNVKVRQIWGMTETSPLGVLATPTPRLTALGKDQCDETIWTRAGRLQFGIELKITDEDGREVSRDGETSGRLFVRGPWVIDRYFESDAPGADADGWFDTGDIATLDQLGYLRITDRAKDVIKSGGEWISSIDIENVAVACPGVRFAGVIGVYHPKWEERPLLVVEPQPGAVVTPDEVRSFLSERIIKWWLPDTILISDMPLTATGKVDKKRLREIHAKQPSHSEGIVHAE
ncbi:long-chain fatty acid--CoA ligase [Sphingobium phenoxybenzoativorans]|uniref:long-chain fatty acid--CoA ligase n=1 Tax=Sphingobium phenoxybenzoativorans TaxID=1592790 RepID=UPI000B324B4E|nr:long-chain fatty acid--CoA ligase [Sphingobium phenoxybenzoativorans]